MPVLKLSDIPQELYNALAYAAENHNRTISEEAILLLEKGVKVEVKKKGKVNALRKLDEIKPFFKEVNVEHVVEILREERDK